MIENLENLGVSLLERPISKKDKSKDVSPRKSTLNHDKRDKLGKEASSNHQKSYELCKSLKKTHDTSECRSKEYYMERMADLGS